MRWAGAALIVLASYLIGSFAAAEEKRRLYEIESLITFIRFMRRRMNGERAPLKNVFSEFEDEYLSSIGFLPMLRSGGDPKTSWTTALALLKSDDDVLRELRHLGIDLGGIPLDDQISRLDGCLAALEEKKTALKELSPKKQKVIKTVCVLAGALVAIIMI